jgi:MFS family permease
MQEADRPWYRLLNGYHWFVLLVCTLGWLFDCLDQQLFNLARAPAVAELLGLSVKDPVVSYYGGLSTALLLIGWASGGIIFGIMGDRIGRVKTMVFTILAYSLFTGLSGLAVGLWDFLFYRFIAGLGVGGQFAVGVTLVAESLPDRARPQALGALQAFSALGNIGGGAISLGFFHLVEVGTIVSAWRWMFLVGVVPALLVVFVITKLREPEAWKRSVAEGKSTRKAGSYAELFGDPRWRRRALVGLALAFAGVVGLWGIGVFSSDLVQTIFRKKYETEAREAGEAIKDLQFAVAVVRDPTQLAAARKKVQPQFLVGTAPKINDAKALYAAALALLDESQPVTAESILSRLDQPEPRRPAQTSEQRAERAKILATTLLDGSVETHVTRIASRQQNIDGSAGKRACVNLMLFNVGAFFGMYVFSMLTHRIGRRPTFALALVAAAGSTALAFLCMKEPRDILWMSPLMGFCQLSIFGGYAIYFPELFPTRLRSTGTSFCYNTGRFVAAPGPAALGFLTSSVFAAAGDEAMRYAGLTMCLCFAVGLLALPFAPETKGQPLPE